MNEHFLLRALGSVSTQIRNHGLWRKALLVAIAVFAVVTIVFSGCRKSEESADTNEVDTIVDGIVQNLVQDASAEQEESLDAEAEAVLLGTEDLLPQKLGETADEMQDQ